MDSWRHLRCRCPLDGFRCSLQLWWGLSSLSRPCSGDAYLLANLMEAFPILFPSRHPQYWGLSHFDCIRRSGWNDKICWWTEMAQRLHMQQSISMKWKSAMFYPTCNMRFDVLKTHTLHKRSVFHLFRFLPLILVMPKGRKKLVNTLKWLTPDQWLQNCWYLMILCSQAQPESLYNLKRALKCFKCV